MPGTPLIIIIMDWIINIEGYLQRLMIITGSKTVISNGRPVVTILTIAIKSGG